MRLVGGGHFEHLLSLHIVYDILGEYEKINTKIKINGLQYWVSLYTYSKYSLYLCTYSFNSNDMTPGEETEGEKARAPGYHMGLTVLVDPQSEDYYYPLLAAYGVKVKT